MRQRPPKRKRIFIGAEGESERSLAGWLKRVCEEIGIHVHLDVRVCGGGDSLAVVEYSVKQYHKRSKQYGKYSSGLIFLDNDHIEEDKRNDRDPFAALTGEELNLIQLVPNLEGLLLRLHPGYENKVVSKQTVKRDLKKKWPEYKKPTSAEILGRRFELQSLQRVARKDVNIRQTLEILGLPVK